MNVNNVIPDNWFEDNNRLRGYKWSVQANHGTVQITEDELFDRREFRHIDKDEYKVAYAMYLGWRWNIDSQMWYRIIGY